MRCTHSSSSVVLIILTSNQQFSRDDTLVNHSAVQMLFLHRFIYNIYLQDCFSASHPNDLENNYGFDPYLNTIPLSAFIPASNTFSLFSLCFLATVGCVLTAPSRMIFARTQFTFYNALLL
ncbi:hypothetical protein CHARACLAT_000874 [Characodon lateralis]|uniref:Uncharacterized protein n=1 Tax=Characodon lateralis TaxID=208331 RepID=A0ABU7DM84_9TELE|nr:hypothetical protein [Characodon lateralis]